jgi:hypothetical protein
MKYPEPSWRFKPNWPESAKILVYINTETTTNFYYYKYRFSVSKAESNLRSNFRVSLSADEMKEKFDKSKHVHWS